MITASEARKKIEDNFEIVSKKEEFNKIEGLINKAINEGQYYVFIDGVLKNTTTTKLEQLGYKIEVGGRYNEKDTVIKW